ncbi:MAG: hypothetical protein KDD56_09705 [Bdellovibrionales bacterium]|nr:hypothetical protein [Bdellovibrionales bacterium]
MNKIKKLVIIFFLSLSLLLISDCGGGTRGTGPNSKYLSGTLYMNSDDLSPVADITITISSLDESGEVLDAAQTTTGNSGFYEIYLSDFGNSILFNFEGEDFNTDLEVSNFSPTANLGIIDFLVETKNVSVIHQEFDVVTDDNTENSTNNTQLESNNNSEQQSNDSTNPEVETETPSEKTTPTPTASPQASPTIPPAADENNNLPDNDPPAENSDPENPSENDNNSNPSDPMEPQTVTICHKSGKKEKTLNVPETAVDAHLAHGDSLGEC